MQEMWMEVFSDNIQMHDQVTFIVYLLSITSLGGNKMGIYIGIFVFNCTETALQDQNKWINYTEKQITE